MLKMLQLHMQNCQSPASMSEWMTIISARDAGASENGELENAKFLAPSLQRAFKSQCCSWFTVHLSLSLCCFPLNPLEIVQSLQTSEYQIGPWYSKAWPNHYISFPVPTFVNSSCNLSLCSRAPLSVTFGKITWMFKYKTFSSHICLFATDCFMGHYSPNHQAI